ncbi:PstS family phosphate ABC transporter substrate-binding protein [Pleurocapsa sp. PCC 7319]|uniref:PstS family phosphate ABC transporter substrate-binding protein n=1 Tax=Pleurocapsa sp. PCC 7319 TaxID=118161 RepID=UPI000345257A|nr:substrate-binding domain-containing protein [Pleurocapsa sp. PCC 7319]
MFLSNDQIINSRNREQANNNITKVCSHCGFDENPFDADNCLQCGRTLSFDNNKNNKPLVTWSNLPLLLLIIVTGGLGLFWRKNSVSLQQSTEEMVKSTEATEGVQGIEAYESGLQLKESFTKVTNVPQGVFFYGGAMASAGIRSQNTMAKIAEAQPQFQLTYEDPLVVPPNSGVGIQMVIDGTISFAESFRPLKQAEYDLASSRGFKLKQVPVATTAIAFYVNPDLNIPGLSLGQVEQIYSGQITNWKQLGGPDLPIVPVSQDPDAQATTSFLLQGMPDSMKNFGDNVQAVRDTTSAVRKVAQTPGAIGYGAQPLVVNQSTIRPIGLARRGSRNYIQPVNSSQEINKQAILDGSYPIIRRIFVILREDGEIDELAGRAYINLLLSKEGQTLIDQAGYLPIRYQTE